MKSQVDTNGSHYINFSLPQPKELMTLIKTLQAALNKTKL